MGIRRTWVLTCDRARCPQSLAAVSDKVVGARGEAREAGWRYDPDGAQWFCPAHAAIPHEPWCPQVTRHGMCRCRDKTDGPPRAGSDIYVAGSTVTVISPAGDIL
jgi:hypothetical protein